jgi:acyl carrier protein
MGQLRAAIVATLADALGVDPGDLTDGAGLYDDLGADSLAVMDVLCALEDELGIELPESTQFAAGLRSVGDIVEAFESRVAL